MIRFRGGAAVQDLLVERARRGDRDAFSVLAARVVDGCYSLAYAVLRDADLARDAVQAALLGAWRDLPDLREVEKFDAWLPRLVVNACYIEARRERRWTAAVRAFPALHDYAVVLYSHAPMATFRQVSASNPSQPPVSGLERL